MKQSQDEMTFLKDLAAQNEKLSAQMKSEQEAAAEYRKVRRRVACFMGSAHIF